MSQVDTFGSYELKRPKQIKIPSDFSTAIEPKVSAANQQTARPDPTLRQELSSDQQMLQYQQGLIESLTEQLASSQAHTAQLESDYAALQQRYIEQSYHLQQTEAVCLDLRTRLHRQQRQTLQFKTALEQCLEPSVLPSASKTGVPQWSAPASPVSEETSLFDLEPAQPSPSLTRLNREFAPAKACQANPAALGSSCKDFPVDNWAVGHERADGCNPDQKVSLSERVRPDPDQPLFSNEHPPKDSKVISEPLEPAEETKLLALPLVFKEQPIQPWSAPQSRVGTKSVAQNQPAVTKPAKPQPTRQLEHRAAPFSQPSSSQQARPRTLAMVELPSFPRYRY